MTSHGNAALSNKVVQLLLVKNTKYEDSKIIEN